jgi:hypothetical protein
VVLKLADGTTIILPTWKAFEDLQTRMNQLNTNVTSLQTIVQALENKDFVTSVLPFHENGIVAGYTITFSKSGSVTIYHGKDGQDGAPGQNGSNGTNGVDGQTPVIGVKKDTDGKYYWTLNGEWLRDDADNKIPTTGKDGVDGAPGQDGAAGAPGQDGKPGTDGQPGTPGTDGKDGITPKFKIEEGYWYVSYDNGHNWEKLGKAVGENGQNGAPGQDGAQGDSMFKDVEYNDSYVIFTLSDGTKLYVPLIENGVSVSFTSADESSASFNGSVANKAVDFKVSVYYSTISNITIYNYQK